MRRLGSTPTECNRSADARARVLVGEEQEVEESVVDFVVVSVDVDFVDADADVVVMDVVKDETEPVLDEASLGTLSTVSFGLG